MVFSRVDWESEKGVGEGGCKRDLTWAGVIVVGMAWEETRAAKAEVRRVSEESMLLVLMGWC